MSASLTTFVHLSVALTGEARLPDDLAKAYFDRAGAQLKDRFGTLLGKFQDLIQAGKDPVLSVREDILPNEEFSAAAKVILLLWYTGGIQNANGDWEMTTADQYYRALIWDAIGAHPPTLSNGYYGHWKYPPER